MSAVSHTTLKVSANLAYNHGIHKVHDDDLKNRVSPAVLSLLLKAKIIVDKESVVGHGIKNSIQDAITAATPDTQIKISSNIYHEELLITKPGLVFEPKDKNGEVILS